MSKFYKPLLVSAGLIFSSAGMSGAASLGLTTSDPTMEASLAFVDYLEFGPDGDLSTFGAEVDSSNGISTSGITELGFGFGFETSDPTNTASGGFDIEDANGLVLAGDLIAIGFTEDVIEAQFGNLSGSEAELFGSSILATISFADPLGLNPFAKMNDGDFFEATVLISNVGGTTVVPVPASLPLLLLGFGGLAAIRSRT